MKMSRSLSSDLATASSKGWVSTLSRPDSFPTLPVSVRVRGTPKTLEVPMFWLRCGHTAGMALALEDFAVMSGLFSASLFSSSSSKCVFKSWRRFKLSKFVLFYQQLFFFTTRFAECSKGVIPNTWNCFQHIQVRGKCRTILALKSIVHTHAWVEPLFPSSGWIFHFFWANLRWISTSSVLHKGDHVLVAYCCDSQWKFQHHQNQVGWVFIKIKSMGLWSICQETIWELSDDRILRSIGTFADALKNCHWQCHSKNKVGCDWKSSRSYNILDMQSNSMWVTPSPLLH